MIAMPHQIEMWSFCCPSVSCAECHLNAVAAFEPTNTFSQKNTDSALHMIRHWNWQETWGYLLGTNGGTSMQLRHLQFSLWVKGKRSNWANHHETTCQKNTCLPKNVKMHLITFFCLVLNMLLETVVPREKNKLPTCTCSEKKIACGFGFIFV